MATQKGLSYQLKKYRPLIKELVKRDLKVKYRRSFLGYLWSLLNPLLMMTVMTLVFSNFFRYQIPEGNYPLYLICGQTLFTFFNESTNLSMYSIINNAPLIKKVYVPKFIFPISKVFSSFVTTSFSLLAILIVMPFCHVRFTPYLLLFWVPLIFLFLFACGMGMVLSALSVYFRDITHLYSVFTLLLMYATPIFYPISIVPEKFKIIIQLNPLFNYIQFFRDVVIYGTLPSFGIFMACVVSSLVMFGLGVLVFHKLQKNFILYV